MKRNFNEEGIRMWNKHFKHLIALVSREVQIKNKMRYYYTCIVMVKPKWIQGAGEGVEPLELSCISGRNAKIVHHFGKHFGSFL